MVASHLVTIYVGIVLACLPDEILSISLQEDLFDLEVLHFNVLWGNDVECFSVGQ